MKTSETTELVGVCSTCQHGHKKLTEEGLIAEHSTFEDLRCEGSGLSPEATYFEKVSENAIGKPIAKAPTFNIFESAFAKAAQRKPRR